MWVGIDDTDGPEGMCTTYITIKIAEETKLDFIGLPRLVRLNPNVPWKTRGNAAIAIRLGIGKGKKIKIGNVKGKDIYAYYKIKEEPNIEDLMESISNIVERYARFDVEKTSPGIIITKDKVSEKLYWKAVREIVNLNDVEGYLNGLHYKAYKNKTGLIGALAAISWRPRKFTYELITYLPEDRWNKDRYVDENSVIMMDKMIKTTFENYDYLNKKVMIKPETLTPVLYGIRGTNFQDLEKAMKIVVSDPFDSYIIYKTNQATDDHLVKSKISEIKEYGSYIIKAKVIEKPKTIKGGHVIFKVSDGTGEIYAIAYDHTLQFRQIIKKLDIGDSLLLYGSLKKYNNTLNLEKIKILKLKEKYVLVNPKCPICNRSMESMGKDKGFRCKKCNTYSPEKVKLKLERDLNEIYYEVPDVARRHLSMPINFLGKNIRDFSMFIP
ncbi:MAG: TiaS agmantine-binding domain-containing protein [Thermoplasmata archaeon]